MVDTDFGSCTLFRLDIGLAAGVNNTHESLLPQNQLIVEFRPVLGTLHTPGARWLRRHDSLVPVTKDVIVCKGVVRIPTRAVFGHTAYR